MPHVSGFDAPEPVYILRHLSPIVLELLRLYVQTSFLAATESY